MTLSEELKWRGFVNQTTLQELSELDKKTWTFYHGFDASADSQTIGNLAAMMLDRLFIRYGHKAIILAGGATSLIGDPGGKDAERPLRTEQTIANNVANAEQELKRVFAGHDFRLVNNLDWTKDLTVIEFLREIGKNFSMTMLMQRDYIANRMGESGPGISFAEFSYTLLQGMDFLHLYDKYGCELQLSGSDQWGNCLSGIDLIRKTRGAEAHALTMPLIVNKATGKKFGKTEEGAVWLDPAKTSPTQFYQFWVNTDDDGLEDYMKIYTELDKETLSDVVADHASRPQERRGQCRLALEVTTLVHGREEAQKASKATDILTGKVTLLDASQDVLEVLRNEIPHTAIAPGASIVEALVRSGLAGSNSDARRIVEGGGVYVNDQQVKEQTLEQRDFINGRLLLRRGKAYKDSALIEAEY